MNRLGIFLGLCVLASVVAALALQFSGVEADLKAATWALTGFSILWVVTAALWGVINPPASSEPELAPLLRDAANLVIGVDGVVLGLVYAFVGDKTTVPLVVKVGSVSLVLGVAIGLLLYSLVAGKITTTAAQAVATGLFSLIAFALSYGLFCIVFALVLPS